MADIDPSYVPVKQTERIEENLRLSYVPTGYLSGDALKAYMEYYRPRERGYQACPALARTENGTLYAAMMCDPFGKTSAAAKIIMALYPSSAVATVSIGITP